MNRHVKATFRGSPVDTSAAHLLEGNVRREAFGAVLEPLHGDALLARLLWAQLIEIRHKDLQSLLRCHAAVPVDQLSLIVDQVKDRLLHIIELTRCGGRPRDLRMRHDAPELS